MIIFKKLFKDNLTTNFAESITNIGLARLNYLLNQKYSFNTKIQFIGAPDFSVTLNENRFKGGFVIGGILTWGDGNIPLIPLEIMPNCCGVLCAKIYDNIEEVKIINKIKSLLKEETILNGLKIKWDIGRKNHFVNFYQDNETNEKYVIVHSSLPETKSDNQIGIGTYYNESLLLQKNLKIFHTPYGIIRYIKGDFALDFFEIYKRYDNLVKEKRKVFIDNIFNNYEIISNENHLGLINMNSCTLGCNLPKNNSLLPITIKPHSKAYLVEPKKQKLTLNYKLPYIVPHGTGFKIKNFDNIKYDFDNDIFISEINKSKFISSRINDIIKKYNSYKVIKYGEEISLFKIRKELNPLLEIKF